MLHAAIKKKRKEVGLKTGCSNRYQQSKKDTSLGDTLVSWFNAFLMTQPDGYLVKRP